MTGARINQAWERFWFAPQSTSTLGVVRIFFGLVMTAWTLALLPVLSDLFGDDGVLPAQPPGLDGVWGLLQLEDGDAALWSVWSVMLIACICLTVGLQTRIAAVLVWVGVMTLERRNPFAINAGDILLRTIAFYLMLAPAGAALSLDRWRKERERFWEFPLRAPWALRLIQLQISVVYISTVWAKVRGTTWNDGTAVSYALRIEDVSRFPVPDFLAESLLLANLMTFGTLAVELSLGVLIWNRAARPFVIALGVLMHLSIEYQIRVGFFAFAIFSGYLAFVPSERMDALVLSLRDRVRARRLARGRAQDQQPVHPSEPVGAAPG